MRTQSIQPQRTQRTQIIFAISAFSAVAFVAAAVWLFVSRPAPLLESNGCRGCNVLLITIDTLRADRVGAFGGPAGLTPNLDRLAAEGVRLTRAYSAAPLTLPSHASILTGTSPPVHGLRTNGLFRLGPSVPTLATLLKAAGYRTGAFVGAFVLDARFGLNRGFDVYDDRYGERAAGDPAEGAERRGDEVIKPAIAWIASRSSSTSNQQPATSDRPWFAWVHLYDPHEPYRAPEPYASQYAPYEAEVAYVDSVVGRLISSLPAGDRDRTLIVVAADHGESLGEHGERTHGVFVYDATMRVPWIIWRVRRDSGFGIRDSHVSDALVRLIDLAPTMLDLLAVPAPASFERRSIVQVLDGTTPESSSAYLEAMDANLTRNWAPLTAIVTRTHKLIELPVPELYDLSADPHERTNLFARDPDRARTLGALLRGVTAEMAARGSGAEKTTLTNDARQRLQALGYVAASAGPGHRSYTGADDPKALIGAANDLQQALATFNGGVRDDAMARVRALVASHPDFTTGYGVLASMQRDTGDLPGAIATLEAIARRGIADQTVMVVLAGYLQEADALDRSIAVLQTVIAMHPDYADAYNSLGVAYSRLGRHEEARKAFARVLDLDPTSATAYENLGIDALGGGNVDAGTVALQRALAIEPRLARAHNALAAAYLRQGRSSEAIAEWERALAIEPQLYDALYNLGTTLWSAGRRNDATPYLDRFVREAPPHRYRADIERLRRMLTR